MSTDVHHQNSMGIIVWEGNEKTRYYCMTDIKDITLISTVIDNLYKVHTIQIQYLQYLQ